ncbi:MAG: uracil-DNA glycosylase [Candidatus Cloacimonetes bacterium]|nr:uracil-DNA glycosylase [Candidatus Cloacimonadota bacterium]MCF7813544.1 uracil-DNA glycosylase [Candidatus Cloacimonadota bacterium]MCF7869285.1 uracil-DNA glycosylase [Candidatus Cloacimonadota bacterium]MCF7884198.1 uracil-DNA glycosylase [Candidatus Cloacimonadota bacterium]
MNEKIIKQYLEYLKLSGIQDIFCSKTVASFSKQEQSQIKQQVEPEDMLKFLEQKYSSCQKCVLGNSRNKFCYGNGSATAKLMLIGEGPGADEDRTGKVFVGRAGQLLTKMLKAINLERDEVYIANIVKCRPPGNRNPLPEEKRACLPYLEEQVEIIKPQLILLLGKVAATTLLGIDGTMAVLRSETHEYKGIKTYVSYHPSALLRNPNWKKPAWIDLQKLQKDYEAL